MSVYVCKYGTDQRRMLGPSGRAQLDKGMRNYFRQPKTLDRPEGSTNWPDGRETADVMFCH